MEKNMEPKFDFIGQELKSGDHVVYHVGEERIFRKGIVEGFTPKKVKVAFCNDKTWEKNLVFEEPYIINVFPDKTIKVK